MMRERKFAGGTSMQGKIALEEHFAIEATLGDSQVFGAKVWDMLGPRLIDVQDLRLKVEERTAQKDDELKAELEKAEEHLRSLEGGK